MTIPKLSLKPLSLFSYGKHIRPFRDWFILLGVVLALILISASWNAWLFYRVYSGESLAATAATSTPSVSTEALTNANRVFEKRAAEAARYRSQYRFIDPSK